jgi:dTMP kinase
MNRRGRFITFEGIEGTGKSTQIRRLAALLRRRGARVVVTREPGGTPAGESLRGLLLARRRRWSPRAELLIVNAARVEHVQEVIGPALRRGAWVICDRFTDATLAYQGYGRGLPLREVRAANALAAGGLAPDRTLLLELPARRSLRRARRRSAQRTRFEDEPEAFHRRVRAGYRALARLEPRRIRRIDASGGRRRVAGRIAEALADFLPGAGRSDRPHGGERGARRGPRSSGRGRAPRGRKA